MYKKIRKVGIALLAVSLLVGNTDIGTAFIVMFLPKDISLWALLVIIIVSANIQAAICYKLGHDLVSVLGRLYGSVFEIPYSVRFNWLSHGFKRAILSTLFLFHDWEATKHSFERVVRSISGSKRLMFGAFFTWLLAPGSRSITAIVLGMSERFGLLLVLTTLHVVLGFIFWGLVYEVASGVTSLF
ncbi:MAG: hypothetical protein KBC81_03350 [Candidatus Pacebacteria bacterium]|nr:hypothetical protein [Candidatus Paceibacterota bacterium]